MEEKVLTVTELSQELKVTPDIIYQMVSKGKIPYFRVGAKSGTIRFRKDLIARWIENQENQQIIKQ